MKQFTLDLQDRNESILSSDDLKNYSALLALLHGKIDSICRLFNKEIIIDMDALGSLNKNIIDKLTNHSIDVDAVSTTIDVMLSNKKILTFASWDRFYNHNWNIENISTRSVYIQWSFFLNLSQYPVPQKHTLSMRIFSKPNEGEILKAVVNGGLEEADSLEATMATLTCKVDFISNILAEELIHIVEEWCELCEPAITKRSKLRRAVYKFRNLVARISEFGLSLLFSLVLAIIYKYFIGNIELNEIGQLSNIINVFIYVLIFFIPFSSVYKFIPYHFARNLFFRLDDIMNIHVFNITSGDIKYAQKLERKSKITKELVLFALGLTANIILSYVFYRL